MRSCARVCICVSDVVILERGCMADLRFAVAKTLGCIGSRSVGLKQVNRCQCFRSVLQGRFTNLCCFGTLRVYDWAFCIFEGIAKV